VVLMCNDPSPSSQADGVYKPTFAGFVDVDIASNGGKIPLRTLVRTTSISHLPGNLLFNQLRVFFFAKQQLSLQIDHSVLGSFGAHGRTCILSRVYPNKAVGNKARLYVFNSGESDVKVTHLNAYEMRSAKISGNPEQGT
jgi:beta-fructofuranosidase